MKKYLLLSVFVSTLSLFAVVIFDKNFNIDNQSKIDQTSNLAVVTNVALPVNQTSNIRSRNFELLTAPDKINFGQAIDIANYVSKLTNIRPAFLLAITQEELSLEKTDMCYLTDIMTGEGVRVVDGKIKPKTMNPTRDIPPFLKIVKELGKDPLKTQITCPMTFGWGGAMGPVDFIPSTWMQYKDRIEKVTSKPADPWDITDAFLAAGMFLSDYGAATQTRQGEWKSAMIYFSGSPNSGYNFYADGAMKLADSIQTDILK